MDATSLSHIVKYVTIAVLSDVMLLVVDRG